MTGFYVGPKWDQLYSLTIINWLRCKLSFLSSVLPSSAFGVLALHANMPQDLSHRSPWTWSCPKQTSSTELFKPSHNNTHFPHSIIITFLLLYVYVLASAFIRFYCNSIRIKIVRQEENMFWSMSLRPQRAICCLNHCGLVIVFIKNNNQLSTVYHSILCEEIVLLLPNWYYMLWLNGLLAEQQYSELDNTLNLN